MARSNGEHYVYARVREDEVAAVKAIAKKDGLSMSNFVRRAINGYLLELGDDTLPMLTEFVPHGRRPKTTTTIRPRAEEPEAVSQVSSPPQRTSR